MSLLRFGFVLLLCLGAPIMSALAQTVPVAVPVLAAPDPGVFRNFVWGVSPADVRQFESARFYKEEGDSLLFLELPPAESEFDVQFRRVIRYDFTAGKLWRASYDFQDLTLPEASKILDLYEDEKLALIDRYGQPQRDDYLWKNKMYFQYPEYWGRALLAKDLRRETAWALADGSAVLLELYNTDPYYKLGYTVTQKQSTAPVAEPFLSGSKAGNPAPRP